MPRYYHHKLWKSDLIIRSYIKSGEEKATTFTYLFEFIEADKIPLID